MTTKTQQLQIRVTPRQKTALRRLARAAGTDVSDYVLSRLVPEDRDQFAGIIHSLRTASDYRYALAELNDFLHGCPPIVFANAVAVAAVAEVSALSPYLQNYVAAMVEQAADVKRVAPPAWVGDIAPLVSPRFATAMQSLRMHLLRSSPVPFKRRNIFVDAAVGARV